MFIARAAAALALLGATAPNAVAENLRQLRAEVSPAGDKGEGFGAPGSEYGEFCALVLGTLVALATGQDIGEFDAFEETYTQVSQSVVAPNGKGKYTCHAKGIDFDGLLGILGVTELSGRELEEACKAFDFGEVVIPIPDGEPLVWPGGCPCNPFDEDSYDWTIKAQPSGNAQLKCSFQL